MLVFASRIVPYRERRLFNLRTHGWIYEFIHGWSRLDLLLPLPKQKAYARLAEYLLSKRSEVITKARYCCGPLVLGPSPTVPTIHPLSCEAGAAGVLWCKPPNNRAPAAPQPPY